ncbi:MAG TPA: PP2C family protein-serine/threonine phosphatase [Candidatus Limnocylindrales bacterium]|nr:PP2C family protein-serine/threonine phosphatase [Candidatus Limnocylindrales bacterium]
MTDAIDSILRPFARVPAQLSVRFEEPAARSEPVLTDGPRLTRDIQVDGRYLGRLVAEGPAVRERVIGAALEAVALAVERLIEAGGIDVAPATGDARSGIAAELALSRVQQRSLVSLKAPDVPGYDLASYYEPAREIGGDFFELFLLRRRGRPLGITIADVTGKGIAAALLMAFARPVIHTALQAASGPADALRRTNRILVDELHTALFITALVARLDVRNGHVSIANAGHEPPLLIPADAGPIVAVEGGGRMLGMSSPLDLPEIELDLAPGDRLLLYTDGVTDAMTSTGERFGKDRMLATIDGSRGGSAHDIVRALSSAVSGFCEGVVPADDVTIVAVGRHRSAGTKTAAGSTRDTGGR